MDNNLQRNKLINVPKIRNLAEQRFKSLSQFGSQILGLKDREGISTRLNNKRVITADELCLMADALEVSVDELRLPLKA